MQCSSCFLNRSKKRKNLSVLTETTVDKVNFKNLVAHSVSCIKKGSSFEVNANKEIILSGGAYGSPTILLRSGIGDQSYLNSKEIDCVVDLKGVEKTCKITWII